MRLLPAQRRRQDDRIAAGDQNRRRVPLPRARRSGLENNQDKRVEPRRTTRCRSRAVGADASGGHAALSPTDGCDPPGERGMRRGPTLHDR